MGHRRRHGHHREHGPAGARPRPHRPGANDGALDATAKEALAVELEGIRKELLSQANTRLLGRSVFAGTSDTAAFAADYSHSGVPGAEVTRRVSDAASVRVDTDGAAVYGTGDDSVFALVDKIVADLRSGTNVGPRLGEIDGRRTAMLAVQGSVGTRQAQIERAKEAAVQNSVSSSPAGRRWRTSIRSRCSCACRHRSSCTARRSP